MLSQSKMQLNSIMQFLYTYAKRSKILDFYFNNKFDSEFDYNTCYNKFLMINFMINSILYSITTIREII